MRVPPAKWTFAQDSALMAMRREGVKFHIIAKRLGHVNRDQCPTRWYRLTGHKSEPREKAVISAEKRETTALGNQEMLFRVRAERGCAMLHEATMAMLARRAAALS